MNVPQRRTTLALVAFSVIDEQLCIILKKGELPRLFVDEWRKLDDAANVLAKRVAGSGGIASSAIRRGGGYLEQLYTFSPRTKENPGIVVSYFLLVASHRLPRHVRADFVAVMTNPNNALDAEIVTYAVQRLRWKVEYTNVVYSLLPNEFTLNESQRTYEAILGRPLDKRNFRKKILTLGILKDTNKKVRLGRTRPAEVYRFRDRKLTYVEVL